LHKVDNKKYMDLLSSNNKLAKSYNTGLLISNFSQESKFIIKLLYLKSNLK